jgi:hypothetical protein
MNLEDESDHVSDFSKETSMPNIWAIHDEDPVATSKTTTNDNDEVSDKEDTSDSSSEKTRHDEAIVGSNLEDDLERPSFLRRLSRRRKDGGADDESREK